MVRGTTAIGGGELEVWVADGKGEVGLGVVVGGV